MSFWNKFKLFVLQKMKCFQRSQQNRRFLNLIQEGRRRLDEDLSVEKIIKNLRDLRFTVDYLNKNLKSKFDQFNGEDIIEIDSCSSKESNNEYDQEKDSKTEIGNAKIKPKNINTDSIKEEEDVDSEQLNNDKSFQGNLDDRLKVPSVI